MGLLAFVLGSAPVAAEVITSTDGCYESHDTITLPDPAPPTVNFRDIAATGTPLGLAPNSASLALPIGFSFYYYGVEYTEVIVSTNGFLTFQAPSSSGCCSGSSLPSTGNPNTTVAGFWKEHDTNLGGEIYTELQGAPGDREYIVQWDAIPAANAGGLFPSTFQIVLQERLSSIEIQYGDADALNRTTSAGIENEDGTQGLEVFRNSDIRLIDQAIRIGVVGDDTDGDNIAGCLDNCPDVSNIAQTDADADGFGDDCDTCVGPGGADADSDGLCTDEDNCPDQSNAGQEDSDGTDGMFAVLEGIDELAPGVEIRSASRGGGGILTGENVEFACGDCGIANFAFSVSTIGDGQDLCGFSNNIPREIIERDLPLCAMDMLSGDLYDLDLVTHGPPHRDSCYDADNGASCEATGGRTSYVRVAVIGGATENVVSDATTRLELVPGVELVFEGGIEGDVEWACGSCDVADFSDAQSQIGNSQDICGYSNNIPRDIVTNGDLLCARALGTDLTWEIDLHSWGSGRSACTDADGGVTCTATGGQTSLSWSGRDGAGDACDNCPDTLNRDQADRDGNGIGDACDDVDSDGFFDTVDNCPDLANADQANNDGEAETVTLGFTDFLEPGTAITVRGGLHVTGGRFACGTCAKADFGDSVLQIGNSEDICGFEREIPRQIVEGDIQLCVEATGTGTLYDLDLLSFGGVGDARVQRGGPPSGNTGCIDSDGFSCISAGDGTSYTRIGGAGGTVTVVHPLELEVDEIDTGIALERQTGRAPIEGDGFEFTCGPCATADFDGSEVENALRRICGNQGPRELIQSGDIACARHAPTGRTWEIDLLSIVSPDAPCSDADGTTCAETGGLTRYVRTEIDGFGDACDNCPEVSNDQTDSDGDGLGDTCDPTPNDELIASQLVSKEKLTVKGFDGVKQKVETTWDLGLRPDGTFLLTRSGLGLTGTWTDPKGKGKKFDLALDAASESQLAGSLTATARLLNEVATGVPSTISLGLSASKAPKLSASLSKKGKVKLKIQVTLDASDATGATSSGKWTVKGKGTHTP